MNNLLNDIENALKNLVGDRWPYAAALLVAVVLLALTAYWTIPAIARLTERARRHTGRHLLPRQLLKELDALLANEVVMNTYAPAQRYIRQLGEDEKAPRINAWTSPFARAVKAAVANENNKSPNQYHDAKKQVRRASKQISIRPMNDTERTEYITDEDNPLSQFVIELKYDGKKPSQIRALMENIKTQLELKDLQSIPDRKKNAITLLCSKDIEIEDRLTTMKHGKEWLDAQPVKNPKQVPIAFTVKDEPYQLPTHHTLINGATGSGKSGPLLNLIYKLAPFVEQGIVKFYGIDPKNADLRLFKGSDLFTDLALTPTEAIDLINKVNDEMVRAGAQAKADLKNGKTGRSNEATKETPWNYFFIDELATLKNQLDAEGPAGKAAWKNLNNIMFMGRARGFFLIIATQDASIELLGKLRTNFGNVILLSQESEWLNKLFLGDNAAEEGYDSTAIPQATPANGYKTSGIGFVKGETGKPMKIRMAYLSEEDLAAFALEHGADPNDEGHLPEDELDALATGTHHTQPSGIDLAKNDDDLPALELDDLDSLPDWAITPNDDDLELPPLD